MKTLAERLRHYRNRKGLSVPQASRAIGVPATTYREWEYGRKISGEPYARIAKAFGVSMAELLGEADASREALRRDLEEIERLAKRVRTLL